MESIKDSSIQGNIFGCPEIVRLGELIRIAGDINIESDEEYNSSGSVCVLSALMYRLSYQYVAYHEKSLRPFDREIENDNYPEPKLEIENLFEEADEIMRRIASRYDHRIRKNYPKVRFTPSGLASKRLKYLLKDKWFSDLIDKIPCDFITHILSL